jgi:hypothetical protein
MRHYPACCHQCFDPVDLFTSVPFVSSKHTYSFFVFSLILRACLLEMLETLSNSKVISWKTNFPAGSQIWRCKSGSTFSKLETTMGNEGHVERMYNGHAHMCVSYYLII